jgi:hypothetical protein
LISCCGDRDASFFVFQHISRLYFKYPLNCTPTNGEAPMRGAEQEEYILVTDKNDAYQELFKSVPLIRTFLPKNKNVHILCKELTLEGLCGELSHDVHSR